MLSRGLDVNKEEIAMVIPKIIKLIKNGFKDADGNTGRLTHCFFCFFFCNMFRIICSYY